MRHPVRVFTELCMQVLLTTNAPVFVGLIQIQCKCKLQRVLLRFFQINAHLSVCKWTDGEVSRIQLNSSGVSMLKEDSLNARQRLDKSTTDANNAVAMGLVHVTGPMIPQCSRTIVSLSQLVNKHFPN